MSILKNRDFLNGYYYHIIRMAAQYLKIQDLEWSSPVEQLEEIKIISPEIGGAVEDLIISYEKWFDIHMTIDQVGNSGNLTINQEHTLLSAIENREQAKKHLKSLI